VTATTSRMKREQSRPNIPRREPPQAYGSPSSLNAWVSSVRSVQGRYPAASSPVSRATKPSASASAPPSARAGTLTRNARSLASANGSRVPIWGVTPPPAPKATNARDAVTTPNGSAWANPATVSRAPKAICSARTQPQ